MGKSGWVNGWEIGSEKRGQNIWEHQRAEKRKLHGEEYSQKISITNNKKNIKIEEKVRERETLDNKKK